MTSPAGKTYGAQRIRAWYGLGVRHRDRGGGVETWHTGSWARWLVDEGERPDHTATSTLAFRSAKGLSTFVHSAPHVGGNARNELLDELIRTARSLEFD